MPLSSAFAADTCEVGIKQVPLERHVRQLYLDLIGRPPTMEEYRFMQSKGAVTEADIDELMSRDDFYARMKTYHRSLLRTNVTASVYPSGDTKLQTSSDGLKPLETRGNPSSQLRGKNGLGCDHAIVQDDCNANPQDPHFNLGTTQCRDSNGVPMPVSVDYDNTIFQCSLIMTTPGGTTPANDCASALSAGLVAEKYRFFCDNRVDGALRRPYLCIPDPTKPSSMILTQEVMDTGGHVVSFANPTPIAGAPYNQLDRCDLSLSLRNNVRGSYAAKRGCWVREGVVTDAAVPYWDKSGATTVTSCAIEAQQRTVNPVTMETCETTRFSGDRSCGCGVGFRRCESGDGAVHNARLAAVNEEPLLIADSVLRRGEDYFNILTTRRSFLNSTLSEFYRQQQGVGVWAISPPSALEALPNIDFTADPTTWTEYVREDQNSGVLTTPAFLYRFPTQRARVAEFYDAFLCKHFAPPADAISPAPEDACNRENNLAKRCGCNYCHATIEPTGAHWGRFGERNATFLTPDKFPRYDAKCRDCALNGNVNCDGECTNYVMQALDGDGANSLGLLKTYLYRTPEEEPNIVAGPKLLVERSLQTGDLQRCAVQKVWQEFSGRPMSEQEKSMYLDSMTQSFEAKGRNMKELIKKVVTSDAYRRID